MIIVFDGIGQGSMQDGIGAAWSPPVAAKERGAQGVDQPCGTQTPGVTMPSMQGINTHHDGYRQSDQPPFQFDSRSSSGLAAQFRVPQSSLQGAIEQFDAPS